MSTSRTSIGSVRRATNSGSSASAASLVARLDVPPDGVAAGEARRRRAAMAQRAGEALPGGEGGRALARLVAVVQEELGHQWSLPALSRRSKKSRTRRAYSRGIVRIPAV